MQANYKFDKVFFQNFEYLYIRIDVNKIIVL